jgi:hypothetical protein
MEKKVEPLKLSIDKGKVWLEQTYGMDEACIGLTLDQIPLLIGWLKEAGDELKGQP